MLSAKAIGELLSHNRDERLCKRWYLMTPNGTLFAYSQPTDINELRKQAAIAAICWQQHDARSPTRTFAFDGEYEDEDEIPEAAEQSPLQVLTMESKDANVIVRRIQEQLLLVLEGGVPPRRSAFERRITAENADGSKRRPREDHLYGHSEEGSSPAKAELQDGRSVAANVHVLRLQRAKLDALAGAVTSEFEQTGFKMPQSFECHF